jgi:hypothetical protein
MGRIAAMVAASFAATACTTVAAGAFETSSRRALVKKIAVRFPDPGSSEGGNE